MLKCEMMSKKLPVLRAMLARELSAQGMSQENIAELLGVSQGAVSQYVRRERGKESVDENTRLLIKEACTKIIREKADLNREICILCTRLSGI